MMNYTKAPILLALVVSVSACGGGSETPEDAQASTPSTEQATSNQRAVRIQTRQVVNQSFDEIIELTGAVEALDDAILSARTSGTVESLVPLGRSVATGSVIARLDAGLSDAALQQAQAQLESAEASFQLAEDVYKRQEPLFRDSIISALEFEQVRTQRNQAQAQFNQAKGFVAQAEEQHAYTRVVAPFPGTIEEHMVEKGEQVAPGTPIVRVVNSRRLKVTAGVPERFAGDIERGSKATISFSTYGIEPIEATVGFVGRAIRSNSRTFPIEVEIPNRDGQLKPEMIASIHLVRNQLDEAVVAPLGSVVRDETGTSVFVVDRSGSRPMAEKRVVTTGPSFNGMVVIEEGLNVGDELIIAGMNDVSPGDPVEAIQSSEAISQEGV